MTDRRLPTETQVARDVERLLLDRLPAGWTIRSTRGGGATDLMVEIGSPNGEIAVLRVEVKRLLEPRHVTEAADRLALAAESLDGAAPVIAAAYLSPRARALLDDLDIGYLDTTGNTRLVTSSPGLYITTPGVDRNPWPQESELRSLRGRGTARALRAIIDTAPPYGIRELAAATGASAPTITRVLDILEREAIVGRRPRGPVSSVDWEAAIRRWAEDYDQTASNTPTLYLEPRGLAAFRNKLVTTDLNYAATGAFAAQHFDPIAPAPVATIYVEDSGGAAELLGLRETDTGANVVLLEPLDPVVFDRTITRDGLRCVAPSQLAVDLLTGPGREPPQGAELLAWMKDNHDLWRT